MRRSKWCAEKPSSRVCARNHAPFARSLHSLKGDKNAECEIVVSSRSEIDTLSADLVRRRKGGLIFGTAENGGFFAPARHSRSIVLSLSCRKTLSPLRTTCSAQTISLSKKGDKNAECGAMMTPLGRIASEERGLDCRRFIGGNGGFSRAALGSPKNW